MGEVIWLKDYLRQTDEPLVRRDDFMGRDLFLAGADYTLGCYVMALTATALVWSQFLPRGRP